jgi:hypothetical protein
LLPQATACDAAGLDIVSIYDHPNYADRVDAYAALGTALGGTQRINGVVNLTNIGIRSAPLLARTVFKRRRQPGRSLVHPAPRSGQRCCLGARSLRTE